MGDKPWDYFSENEARKVVTFRCDFIEDGLYYMSPDFKISGGNRRSRSSSTRQSDSRVRQKISQEIKRRGRNIPEIRVSI